MRRLMFGLLILLFVTLTCMTTAPEAPALKLPTAFVVTAGLVAPQTATIEAVNPTPSALPALPAAPDSETEYRLRVEISTGSDWTNLEILNSEIVRDVKITATDGTFTNHTAAPNLIAMNQTLENAQAGKTIKLQVDLYIEADAKAEKLEMILKKGSIGLATLRFYKHSDAGDVLIQEVAHYLVEDDTSGLNPLPFSIYLNSFP